MTASSTAYQNGNWQFAEQLAAVEARRGVGCQRIAPSAAMIGVDGDLGIEACRRPMVALTGERHEVTPGHDQKPLAATMPHEGRDVFAIGACDLDRFVTAFAKESRMVVAKLQELVRE